MKIKELFFLLVFTILAIWALSPKSWVPTFEFFGRSSSAVTQQTVLERQAIAKKRFDELRTIVEAVRGKDARAYAEGKEVYNLIADNSDLAIPSREGIVVVSLKVKEKELKVMPLLPADARFPQWKKLLDAQNSAAFVRDLKTLVLEERGAVSALFSGLTVYHEGIHALLFLKTPNVSQTVEEACYEEAYVHARTNRLLAVSGGREYERLIGLEVKRLRNDLKMAGRSIDDSFPLIAESYSMMDAVFGPPLSVDEANMRQTAFWFDSVFRLIDEDYNENKEMQKAVFVHEVYKALGFMK